MGLLAEVLAVPQCGPEDGLPTDAVHHVHTGRSGAPSACAEIDAEAPVAAKPQHVHVREY